MELSHNQFNFIMRRYPKFEMSYETVSQKGDMSNYDICIAIPIGKKAFIWNTFHNDKDVSYILDINNRDKNISRATLLQSVSIHPMSHNTIIYLSLIHI